MTTVADIRKQYPQYDDLPDEKLVNGFHAKFYSDMPLEEFHKKVGFTSEKQTRPTAADIPDDQGNKVIPPEPAPESTFAEKASAAIETVDGIISGMATGLVAMPYGIVKDIYERTLGEGKAGVSKAGQFAGEVMKNSPLQPKTALGQEYMGKVGEVMLNVPAFIPEVSGISSVGMVAKLSSMLEQRKAFKSASAAEKPTIVESIVKEHPEYTKEQVNSFLDAPEDVHINAKARAQKLIEKGATNKEIESAIEKHPLVGQYLEEYKQKYSAIQEATGKPERTPSSPETTFPNGQKKVVTDTSGGIQEPTSFVPREEAIKAQELVDNLPVEEVSKASPTELLSPKENLTMIQSVVNTLGKGKDNVLYFPEIAFGTISTRLHNALPEVGRKAQDVDNAIRQSTHNSIIAADKGLAYLEEGTPILGRKLIDKAIPSEKLVATTARLEETKNQWLNQNRDAILKKAEASGDAKVVESTKAIFKAYDEVGREGAKRGLHALLPDYLARIVKDRKGLLESQNLVLRTKLEKELRKATKEKGLEDIRQLDDLTFSQIINSNMRKPSVQTQGKGSHTKSRVFDEITPEMQKFYYDPVETFHTSIERAWSEIHTADFFGTSKVIENGKVNLDGSIGNFLAKLAKEGKIEIGSPKWYEIERNLETRFKFGHLTPKESVQNINNATTLFSIANGITALANLGDFVSAPFYYSPKAAMIAVAQKITGKSKYSIKDFGYADHLSEEFIGHNVSQGLTDKAMSLSGWKKLDPLGKDIHINASLIRAQGWAKTEAGLSKMSHRYGEAYGSDFPQLVKDLQEGKDTPLTRSMVIWDVVQHHPMTKLQKSEMQTRYPNTGGMATKLKSYVMSQADFLRRNAYNEFKAGNFRKGFRNLTVIASAWAAMGASQKAIKDFFLMRDVEIKEEDILANMLGQIGYSSIAADKAKKGDIPGAVGSYMLPPALTILLGGWVKKEKGEWVMDEAGIAGKTPIVGKWLKEEVKKDKEKQKIMEKSNNG